METRAHPELVFVDSSVLINFLHLERLDLLSSLKGLRCAIPQEVEQEILRPELTARLRSAVQVGLITVEHSTDLEEIERAASLRMALDRGESACLAMAERRGCLVACDERGRFLREARDRLGLHRVLNTPGLLLRSIREGLLEVREADHLKALLEKNRYKMRFESFAALV